MNDDAALLDVDDKRRERVTDGDRADRAPRGGWNAAVSTTAEARSTGTGALIEVDHVRQYFTGGR